MRKIKEVLRLRFELGLGQRAIARACSISQSTVHEYLNRAAAAGVGWPLPEGWDEERVEKALFGEQRPVGQFPELVRPDFPALHAQLQQHPHLTLQLVWEEYRQVHREGYGYSRFCELYGRWRRKQDVVLRQEHKPGEKGFVDWAGATIPVHDPTSGEIWPASLFVMVLGASSYTYAEATRDQQLTAWLSAHMHAFEYFGGVPRLLVPDNPRTGVSRACRYDPDLNPTYQEMAMHYGVGVVPARPYRPRDKAKVEVGVQVVERWIIAALRHQKFFRLEEVNRAIRELLERLNQRPFRKREGSRTSVFASLERSALRALPAERFDMSEWSRARVNIDYHIAFDANFYSVPYVLVQELVEVRATPTTVEIFHRGQRVASHLRGRGRGQLFKKEHRPKSHQAHLEWTPSRMVHWAEQIGPNTAQLFARILAEKPHPEMGYRSCLGIIRLAEQYSASRMEAAADRALLTGACRYQSMKSILKNSLDQQPLTASPALPPPPAHDNIRGAEYFEYGGEKTMLQQPMMEKLHALKLQGLLEALERQEQDETARELSFLDRLALLIDQQWNWRQNQALARRVRASRLKGAACVENIDYRAERGLSKSVIRALAQDSTWVKNHEHIFVLGPTGVGKSYVASALAQKACRDGYSVYYTRTAALFRDLNLARADGSLRQLLKRLNRIDVLVVDDWAMAPMSEAERRDFWEIAEDRYQTRSMILTSQLPVSRWHEQIGDPTLADGILDRLVHNAHRIEMRGESLRKQRGEKGEK